MSKRASRQSTAVGGSACAVVLAAGRGTRMRSGRPKVLHEAQGAPLLHHVLQSIEAAGIRDNIVVTGYHAEAVEAAFRGRDGVIFCRQAEQRGTGDAVLSARAAWERLGSPSHIIVACGDAPLVLPGTLLALCDAHRTGGYAATILTAEVPDPTGYGRIRRGPAGEVTAIVEQSPACDGACAIHEINSGTLAFQAEALWPLLEAGGVDLPPGREHYLTDVVAELVAAGHSVGACLAPSWQEVLGVNTLAHLHAAQRVLWERTLARLGDRGVSIPHPAKVVIEWDVEIGSGTVVHPFSVIERGVQVGRDCQVGPFAHLATGTVLEDGAAIGNFVEVKRTRVGAGAKAKHLAYLGDGEIGARANLGAGTVFCNYDGVHKHRTVVGEGSFVGSGTMLVAPVEIEAGGRTGAGAVVPSGRTVGAGETWVGVPARPIGESAQRKGEGR